jgi:alkanesulfonate monooxygenase SsuD/methylene tetrahydromethanopterin reductase-like flavin-dependent oxidoreductase (luciferase family)
MERAFGVDAGLAPDVARELAATCATLGYSSLWVNDEPYASGLDTLAHFAAGAPGLPLGVGVLPLHRWPPARIVADVERLGLDPTRLWLGVGSGTVHPQLDAMERTVAELRRLLPNCRIVLGTIRSRLARLGGAIADAVLLNWMLPATAAAGREWVHDGAQQAARVPPPVALYVRVAVGAGAEGRLRTEELRYRELNDQQRRHFEAMHTPVGSVGIAAADRRRVLEGLAPYEPSVDLTIVRALAPTDDSVIEIARAAAPSTDE